MYELVSRGGPVMIPIILASIAGFAVFVARLWTLRRDRVVPRQAFDSVRALVAQYRAPEAAAECTMGQSSLERILATGLHHAGAPRVDIKERMEEVGRREYAELSRYVSVVGVVATIEPLLGLLGTVTGMIGVFQGVVGGGVGDPAALASGIWSALITTAAGLTTGIPAYLGWRYLMAKVDDRMQELEAHALLVLDMIAGPDPRQLQYQPYPSGGAR
ncbi:MAG: MotA/TolQ/ExbB proton channel family protein [Myxococcales bacterium]|nr:MotA/TolQ/ExbB proton channel family protein [Myxococcales bacterium]MDD9967001.1 MotA/TolQ/ExbB proton channel family protein [Myxococcales bacterium]